MKLLFLLLLPCFALSQKVKSDSLFEYKYFKNGKISTKVLIPTNTIHFGYFKAYKQDGTEIYSMSIRNVGGHSSVDATYYPNGAIAKAHYHGQPDGGIQHEEVIHYFDEKGNVTNVEDLSDDGFGRTVTAPFKFEKPVVAPPKNPDISPQKTQEVAKCAVIYQSEIYVVNLTKKRVSVQAQKTPPNGIDFLQKANLNPGDTLKFGTFVEAQMYTHPSTNFELSVMAKNKKNLSNFRFVWDAFEQDSPEKRKYFLLLIDLDVK